MALTVLKFIYLTEWFILHAILLFLRQYLYATSHCSRIIFLEVTFSGKQHLEPGEIIFTHSALFLLVSLLSPWFHCIDCDQHLFSLFLRPLCWPNQSGIIWWGTHISLLSAFQILNNIVQLYIKFIICLAIMFALTCIIQVTPLVKPIFSVGSAFKCAILISICLMMVDLFYSADM